MLLKALNELVFRQKDFTNHCPPPSTLEKGKKKTKKQDSLEANMTNEISVIFLQM
jgi:hypothetical protein